MRVLKKIGIILSFILLSGCASSQNTLKSLPRCDGYSKRPLNRSMWNWRGKTPASTPIIIGKTTDITSSTKKDQLNTLLAKNLTPKEIESYKNCGENV
ncbi:type IV secretion protein VblB7 [Bartonella sp. CB169]|uniref:type IV secretion protein VblB7 n=1 Tax=Bartonella sp. CB169 TaxID=3112257 RepID=UPI00300E0C68